MATVVQYILGLTDNLSGPINRANSSVNNFERSMESANGTAKSLGTALGLTFGIAGIALFAKNIVSAGTKVEDARTGLTTLLKDANEAQSVIDNTMTDAMKTPFNFDGLLMANKALISAGIESGKAREDVLNLSNAIAATGGGNAELERMIVNLQQISNTGKATALDIKQFAYAGVNIYKVLEAAGIKASEKGKQVEITYDQITSALKKAHEAGGIYYHGLENMSGNTSVKISNLGDAFFQLSVKMFNDLKPAIEWLLGAAFKLIEKLRSLWDWAMKNKEIIKGLGASFLALWAGVKIGIPLLEGLGIASTAALGPIGLLVVGVSAIATAWASVAQAEADYDAQHEKHLQEITNADEAAIYAKAEKYEKDGKSKQAAFDEAIKYQEQYLKEEKALNLKAILHQGENGLSGVQKQALQEEQERLERQQAALGIVKAKGPMAPKAKALASPAKGGITKVDTKSKATGSKSVTINVSIKDLIGVQNINTTNLKEGTGKIRDLVVSALTGAVNDFQVVAGQ